MNGKTLLPLEGIVHPESVSAAIIEMEWFTIIQFKPSDFI